MKLKEALAHCEKIRHPYLFNGHWMEYIWDAHLLLDTVTGTICGMGDLESDGWEVWV